MAPRRKRRDQWRKTKTGLWTISLGSRGRRVTLFENPRSGFFYRQVFQPDGRKDRRSLGTRDRQEAERMGRSLLALLLAGTPPKASVVVRLGELADAFIAESPMFLDNAPATKADAVTRIAILRAALGDATDVGRLTEHHVRQYEARRRAGGIRYGDKEDVTPAVRQRSVQADVKLLKQMLNWGCSRPMADGGTWLDRNPLAYVRVRAEADVRRPVATFERFEATRKAMQKFQARYAEEAQTLKGTKERRRAERRLMSWVRAELALVLLEATGRRRGAIAGLRWADIDFTTKRITWRAEYDKKKRTSVVGYPGGLFDVVREFQRRLGAVGGYIFPRGDEPERPAPPELISQRLRDAENAAGLPKLLGGTTHPYRRKWRSERAHHPIKAVAVAGGWTDLDTMLRCYDQPDDADLLAVTSETQKRRDPAAQAAEAVGA